MPRSGHAAAGLKQFCDFGQHADRRFAGHRHLRSGPGRRCWKVPDLLGGRRAVWTTGAWTTGTRTTTEVSSRPTLRIVIVSVRPGAALSAARSALAARLISPAGSVAASSRRPMRSWPDANWTAPNVAEAARAAKNALKICDMTFCPAPQWRSWTQPGPSRRGSGASRSLNRVRKIFAAPWNDSGGLGVIPAAGYSPCPIDRRRRVRPW